MLNKENKLIAKFMKHPYGKFIGKRYDKSWEFLMPVIYKCLEVCHEKMLNEWENSFADKFLACDIKIMYKEIIKFIKWYYKNHKIT